ncbi:MAG TPA: cupin domain-containing protein [Chloroflexota bacterium]|nr:cupin domain-containing protein [Chloroflexota bacterium]
MAGHMAAEAGDGAMQWARYLRLYTDEAGESHFAEVEVPLPEVDFAPPAAPMTFARLFGATDCGFLGAPAHWDGKALHPSPRRMLLLVLVGECEVTASDGEVRRVGPSSVLLQEDTSGRGHSTRVVGPHSGLAVVVGLE